MSRPLLSKLFFLFLFPIVAGAQAPLEPAQLPSRTIFYFIWHGSPAADERKTNALMSLWDDPGFAPARAALVDALLNDAKKQKEKSGMTREEIAQFATLLDNPFTIGYLPQREGAAPKPAPTAAATTKKDAPPATPSWNGAFLVYDRTGKEELLSKLVLRMRGSDAEIPKLSEVTFAGVKALKVERKSGTTYWAETGKYAVSASDPTVFEEVLTRLGGKSAGNSLAETAAYREAKPLVSSGVAEFFLRVPEIKDIAGDTQSSQPQVQALWNSIHLDSVHVFAGHISLEGTRTRLQGAVLGDTAEGSLFDIWSAGQKQPASLAYITPDTVYYNESQIDLVGIYRTLKRALASSSQNTSAVAAVLESAAQTRLGMPLADALALTTGEFGTLQTSPVLDPNKKLFFAGIHNKADSLKLIRTLLGDQLTSERTEGNVTYLKISLKGSQGSKGVAQWNFYHLALTSNLLLGASKGETVRSAVALNIAGDPALPRNLQAAREKFPEKLNGFTYFDLQKLDWPALKDQWAAQANDPAADTKSLDSSQKSKRWNDLLMSVDPGVFPRHLHSLTGASWKDSTGVHFDEWVD